MALCLAGSLTGLLGACVEAPDDDGARSRAGADSAATAAGGGRGEGPGSGTPAAQDSTTLRGVLPGLFGIMVGLQEDMRRLDRGLWIESYDSIAVAARAVADHPTVPPEEFQRISGVLGDEMTGFRAMDFNVHDLAVELEEHARAGRLEEVLSTGAELRRGCVACHTDYRARLREGLAGTVPR